MTLESLLELARRVSHQDDSASAVLLANGVLELLNEGQPCMMTPPQVVSFGDGTRGVLVDDRGDPLTVSESRAYAAMVLRQADEAEA